jgi:hypothetical protein
LLSSSAITDSDLAEDEISSIEASCSSVEAATSSEVPALCPGLYFIGDICKNHTRNLKPLRLFSKVNNDIPIELPQLNTVFSRILAYSQDFIPLYIGLTIK